MTEERFGEIIENAVESAAQRLDQSLERSMKHKGVRYFTKSLSFAASIGLIAGAIRLKRIGYNVISIICLITGFAAATVHILSAVFFRRV